MTHQAGPIQASQAVDAYHGPGSGCWSSSYCRVSTLGEMGPSTWLNQHGSGSAAQSSTAPTSAWPNVVRNNSPSRESMAHRLRGIGPVGQSENRSWGLLSRTN